MEIKEKLKTIRERFKLTQLQMAELLDVPENTIARWERGTLNIRHPKILSLALTSVIVIMVSAELATVLHKQSKTA